MYTLTCSVTCTTTLVSNDPLRDYLPPWSLWLSRSGLTSDRADPWDGKPPAALNDLLFRFPQFPTFVVVSVLNFKRFRRYRILTNGCTKLPFSIDLIGYLLYCSSAFCVGLYEQKIRLIVMAPSLVPFCSTFILLWNTWLSFVDMLINSTLSSLINNNFAAKVAE